MYFELIQLDSKKRWIIETGWVRQKGFLALVEVALKSRWQNKRNMIKGSDDTRCTLKCIKTVLF